MDLLQQGLLVVTVVIMLITKLSSFDGKGAPTCNRYVINTYLYLALSILLLGWSMFAFPYSITDNLFHLFSVMILSLVLVVYIAMQNDYQTTMKEVWWSHISWIGFIVLMSFITNNYFQHPIYSKHVSSVVMMVALIFTVMSSIVYLLPEFFEETYSQAMLGLILGLMVILLVELLTVISLFFGYKKNSIFHYTSYIVILLFSFFVSYDTSRMFSFAQSCQNMPNYPKASITFFLDIINLFQRIMFLRR